MSTLLLRFAGVLQSWGMDKFERRGTEHAPTKSAVVGFIAAAMGMRREDCDTEKLKPLNELKFGVRVDRKGELLRDFHTAKDEKRKDSYVTNRYYLSDALFLVGLEGETAFLKEIENALNNPFFPLFLGRRSCPPEGQITLGIREKPLLDALKEEPWLASEYARRREEEYVSLEIFTDGEETDGNVFYSRDLPLSFDQTHRKYGFRRVAAHSSLELPNPDSRRKKSTV